MGWSFTVLGGGQEIGANSYLLQIDGLSFLLDAGLHPKKFGLESLPDYSLITRELEAIFISHAHLDHIGSLPVVARQQPQAPIFATLPTRDIALRMLHNTVTVMNIYREEKGIVDYPFFDHEDLWPLERDLIGLEFNPRGRDFNNRNWGHGERVHLRGEIQAQFIPSGHVLGAGGLFLQQGRRRIFYTGDISLNDQALIPGAVLPDERIDALILECTYAGDPTSHSSKRGTEIEAFARETSRVLKSGGSVLIPAFALGKTQELLYLVHTLTAGGRIPPVPRYISGLGKSITEIYQDHRRHLHRQVSPLSFELYSVLGLLDDLSISKLLREPCLIIATNGMMVENTPSARLARWMVAEEKHGIFFCGYVDPDTLGHRVLHAHPGDRLAFNPQEVPVEVRNDCIRRFYLSSHADRPQLLEVARRLHPRMIVLVHGEKGGMDSLQEELEKDFVVVQGEKGKTIDLD
ncbi:MAG: metallo-beta-lactamase [Deltaproteobacteria bacterium]|nr:metallo-beta-lactamase [Deltaproteobacteria bacterium]